MAKYRATISFAGTITMRAEETRELDDEKQKALIKDLLAAGYIVPAEPAGKAESEENTSPPPQADKEPPATDSDTKAAADEESAEGESEQTEDNSQAAENEQAVEEQPESDVVENETKRSKKK